MPSDNKNPLKAAADKIMGTSLVAAAPTYGGAPAITPFTSARGKNQARTEAVVGTGPGGVYDPEANDPMTKINEEMEALSQMSMLMYKQQADRIAADTARYNDTAARQQAEYNAAANQSNAIRNQISAIPRG